MVYKGMIFFEPWLEQVNRDLMEQQQEVQQQTCAAVKAVKVWFGLAE